LIDAMPTPNGTIITIRNYNNFQKEAKSEDAVRDAQTDAQCDAPVDAAVDPKSTQREEEINNNTLLKESERRTRATRIPSDFDLDEKTHGWALERLGTSDAVLASVDRFRNHYGQVPGDRGLSHDWQAKARNWIDEDVRNHRGKPTTSAVPLGAGGTSDARWDGILKMYAATGHWTRHVGVFGPNPTSPGCRAPKHLLIKHGLATENAA
jgi:hypothetical protein